MSKFNGLENSLKDGYKLGCWSSGGRVPIAVMMSQKPSGKNYADAEGGTIAESLDILNKSCLAIKKGEKPKKVTRYMTGGAVAQGNDLLPKFDQWIRGGNYLCATYESHSQMYVVLLDGYNEDIEKVVRIGCGSNLIKAIAAAFKAPAQLSKKL